jgi:hypothetical protein
MERIEEMWNELRSELMLLQNLEKKQLDLTNHLSMNFKVKQSKEEYFEELQKKFEHVNNASKRHGSLENDGMYMNIKTPKKEILKLFKTKFKKP